MLGKNVQERRWTQTNVNIWAPVDFGEPNLRPVALTEDHLIQGDLTEFKVHWNFEHLKIKGRK